MILDIVRRLRRTVNGVNFSNVNIVEMNVLTEPDLQYLDFVINRLYN